MSPATTKQTVASDLQSLIATLKTPQTSEISEASAAAPVTTTSTHDSAEPRGEQATVSRAGESLVGGATASEPEVTPESADSMRPREVTPPAVAPGLRTAVKRDIGKRSVRKRSVGKRSDPDYQLVGAYVRKPTMLAVKQKLLTRDQDVSELIEELLSGWLTRRA